MTTNSDLSPRAEASLMPVGRLLISCEDQRGIVAAVSRCLGETGANIVQSDQYSTDPEGGRFFMRLEFQVDQAGLEALPIRFAAVADEFGMKYRLAQSGQRKRVALMVSRPDHCILDLLWRWRRGELAADIAVVVSNHDDLRGDVAMFGVPYVHIPVERGAREVAERCLLELLADEYDLIVLARYMQILSPQFLEAVGIPIINIHHSFLPAFAGADPYARAHARGVKLIGATAHYVNEELDEGPIIEQDTIRVTHRSTPQRLAQIGRDIERTVLARAVAWHLEDRVLITDNRTVVLS